MVTLGTLTMCCTACGADYDLPLYATTRDTSDRALNVALNIAEPDVILVTQWALSHRGPVVPLAA